MSIRPQFGKKVIWLKHLTLDVSLLSLRDGVYLVTGNPSSRSSVLFLDPHNLLAAGCDSHQNLFLSWVTFLLYYSLDVGAKEKCWLSSLSGHSGIHPTELETDTKVRGRCNGHTVKGQKAYFHSGAWL